MKKFFAEFREFALKGSVMDMAVGIIIGGAFQSIITAFVDYIVSPIIGLAFQTDLSGIWIPLTDEVYLGVGAFVTAIINFILMALVLFLFVKGVNKMKAAAEKRMKKGEEAEEEEAAPTTEELLTEILAELKKRQ